MHLVVRVHLPTCARCCHRRQWPRLGCVARRRIAAGNARPCPFSCPLNRRPRHPSPTCQRDRRGRGAKEGRPQRKRPRATHWSATVSRGRQQPWPQRCGRHRKCKGRRPRRQMHHTSDLSTRRGARYVCACARAGANQGQQLPLPRRPPRAPPTRDAGAGSQRARATSRPQRPRPQ